VIAAAAGRRDVAGIVLVDTMKDLAHPVPPEVIEQMMQLYRTNFRHGVEHVFPQYLYSPATPPAVRERLQREFLAAPDGFPITAIEPLYKGDLPAIAASATVPVRGINGDLEPTDPAPNRAFFADYDAVAIAQCGHYPMLEKPAEFNAALEQLVAALA